MTDLYPQYGASFAAKKRGAANPDTVMLRLHKENPRRKPEKIYELWIEEILEDRALVHAALLSEAVRSLTRIVKLQSVARESKIELVEYEKKKKEKIISEKVKEIKSVWLSTVMASTFGELAKAGPKFVRLSKMGNPDQRVSDVMSESAVQKILGT